MDDEITKLAEKEEEIVNLADQVVNTDDFVVNNNGDIVNRKLRDKINELELTSVETYKLSEYVLKELNIKDNITDKYVKRTASYIVRLRENLSKAQPIAFCDILVNDYNELYKVLSTNKKILSGFWEAMEIWKKNNFDELLEVDNIE
jgi:hypothetical protein